MADWKKQRHESFSNLPIPKEQGIISIGGILQTTVEDRMECDDSRHCLAVWYVGLE
jgi:hypothetical protein